MEVDVPAAVLVVPSEEPLDLGYLLINDGFTFVLHLEAFGIHDDRLSPWIYK